MITTLTTEKLPIQLWLEHLDEDTLQQAKNLANHPFITHHIAIMPDAHVGYGMPIGGVAATIDAIIPNGVGVDIGCGVNAVQTNLARLDRPVLKKLLQAIRTTIPLGFKHHSKPQPLETMPDSSALNERDFPIVSNEFASARQQIGTLGGGNHFIEIQLSDDGHIWLMIHSGSRNLGYQVANHYNRLAVTFSKKHNTGIAPKWQLDVLLLNSRHGQDYLREMHYCVAFAAANRKAMMIHLQQLLGEVEPSVTFAPAIDIAHNYAAKERHFGAELTIHRKGATRAGAGETGIIPGSQGSCSYIVQGCGNPQSFHSSSHGAGRVLGRKQAQRQLDLQQEVKKLDDLGILHSIRHKRDLDEAAGAYKDIDQVMVNQTDLVKPVIRLTPLAVIKG
jgi:tRNA-splicing ligase RtcB